MGAGGLVGWRRFSPRREDLPDLRHFSHLQAAILLCVYEVLFDDKQRGYCQGGDRAFLRDADTVMGYYPPFLRQDLQLALSVLNVSPVLAGRFASLAGLSVPSRLAVLQRLETSRLEALRLAQAGVREMCGFLHLGNPGVWPHIGYEGPWVK